MVSWGDVRLAFRSLVRAPSFTVTSILLMAVGVGTVTTVYTLMDHIFLRPLPYPVPEQLFVTNQGPQTGPAFRRLEEMQTVAEWAGAWVADANIAGPEEPLRLRQARVTENFFGMLGTRDERGRVLSRDDFAAANSVVLSADAWRRIWGADPSLVGSALHIDGVPVTVVGVLGDGFCPPRPWSGPASTCGDRWSGPTNP